VVLGSSPSGLTTLKLQHFQPKFSRKKMPNFGDGSPPGHHGVAR
jgi:hypothetical protein